MNIDLNIELMPKQLEFQALVEYSDYEWIGYGGARGGAKSHAVDDLLLSLGIKYRIYSLLFRRFYNELLDNHINPIFERFPGLRSFYNATDRILYNPCDRSPMIRFGYAEYEADITKFQGGSYPIVAVDEATQSTQYMIEFLRSCNRDPQGKLPGKAKILLTGNPGGIGHSFYRRIFIDKTYIGEEDPSSYCFIQSHVWDNVYWSLRELEKQGHSVYDYYYKWTEQQRIEFTLKHSDYAKNLARIEKFKLAHLYGRWDVFEGQFFREWHPEVHVLPKSVWSTIDLSNWRQGAGMDYGNVTVCMWAAKDHLGNIHLFDEFYDEMSVRAKKIADQKKFMEERGYKHLIIADTNMWNPDGFDLQKINTPAMDYMKAGYQLIKVAKPSLENRRYRVNCNDTFQNLLHWEDQNGLVNVRPKIYVWDRCTNFIRTFPSLITDDKDNEDIADGQEDHCYDAAKHIVMSLIPGAKPKDEEPYARQYLKQPHKPKRIRFA